jgi:hypothetical protein
MEEISKGVIVSMKKIVMILLLGMLLTSCGSNGDDSEGSEDGSGGYLSCVLEYYQLRNEGVISATDAEIQSECSSSSLP